MASDKILHLDDQGKSARVTLRPLPSAQLELDGSNRIARDLIPAT